MSDPDTIAKMAEINRSFATMVPHNKVLGLEFVQLEARTASMKLPWRPELVGNPDTGVLHGGAITSLLDACSGAAVFMALKRPRMIATLDLRIDYLRPAAPRQPVLARAECYRVTRSVAFVRSTAYQDDPDTPIAAGAGAFMVGSGRKRNSPK